MKSENNSYSLASPVPSLNPYYSEDMPKKLKEFYDKFADQTPGEYTSEFIGVGIEDLDLMGFNFTVTDLCISRVDSPDREMEIVAMQGYAQLIFWDTIYASCIMIGKLEDIDVNSVTVLVDHLDRTAEEREEEEEKKKDAVSLSSSYYVSVINDPIRAAQETCGLYIIHEKDKFSTNVVLQALGIADLVDNTACKLAIAANAYINTFTSEMTFTVAASVKFIGSKRFSVAAKLGLLNGKLNEIGFSVRAKLPLGTTGIFFTQFGGEVKGFQEPMISFKVHGGMAFGNEIPVKDNLGRIGKAIFPSLKNFHPLELTVGCEFRPADARYTFSATGLIIGNFYVSGSLWYDRGDIDAELSAGTVRNNYLNGVLFGEYHKRSNYSIVHAGFNCKVEVDWKLVGLTISGGIDVSYKKFDYFNVNDSSMHNRTDLMISVSGTGKLKLLFFSVNKSYSNSWVINLGDSKLASSRALMANNPALPDADALANANEVMSCESEDIAENKLPVSYIGGDIIEAKSWTIDEQCSNSGIITFEVAAQYTLVDSSWCLIHTANGEKTVYTVDNSEGFVTRKDFSHSNYELVIDTPEAGNWTLEILGDKKSTGGIYLDALEDAKIVSNLEIKEQTDSYITFGYKAFTGYSDDNTVIYLYADEISEVPGDNPFSGVIGYLQESEAGEYTWEIPEDFCHNSKYRFYLKIASSDSADIIESNSVETEILRQEAELDCSWELFYSAKSSDTVTAVITITNTGRESTSCQWELLDYTNKDSVDLPTDGGDTEHADNTTPDADVIASGVTATIEGNKSITFQHVITITDELRDNPSALQLAVNQITADGMLRNNSGGDEEQEDDDTDTITFAAMDSLYSRDETISWDAIKGAASYVLQYALEGDWEEGGVYVNDIKGTSYTISAAPGEYEYRVIALDANGKAIGSWSEEKDVDIMFSTGYAINVAGDLRKSRGEVFELNDGIYNLNGSALENFTGTLTLYRNDMVKTGQQGDSTKVKIKEKKILTLKFVDGNLSKPVSDILLDHGDYFWEWKRTGKNIAADSGISMQLSGEVFSIEDKDRADTAIGGSNSDVQLNHLGCNSEIIEGEVGFCNKDAIWRYMTDEGGELSLTIKSGTVFDAKVKVAIYEQNANSGKFRRIKSLTVNAGEYVSDEIILDDLALRNNFYIQITSWDNGKGKHNTDYSFDLSFDAFENVSQHTDILKIDGDKIKEWIGYRNDAHRYLLQVDSNDLYSFVLEGDAGDAVLKICNMNGKVIKKMNIQSDGIAEIDNLYLESGNYYVDVESKDKGKGKYNTDYTLQASRMQTIYPVELLEIDGSSITDWVGSHNGSDTYRLEVDQSGRYAIRLEGDVAEATLKVCTLKGKVIKKQNISADGRACIDDIELDSGNYFVVVEAKDKGKGKHNTDYKLTASTLTELYPKIDNSNDTWKMAAELNSFDVDDSIEAWVGVGDKADFFQIDLAAFDDSSQYLTLTLDENTAQALEDDILKFSCVNESGRKLSIGELEFGQLYIKKDVAGLDSVFVGVSLKDKNAEDVDYSFKISLTSL